MHYRTLRAALLGCALTAILSPLALAQDATVLIQPTAVAQGSRPLPPPGLDMRQMERSDYVTLYPGVYAEHEKGPVAGYFAQNQAIRDRGPIDVQALVSGKLPKDTPGLGPIIHVTADWLAYQNGKYDPLNPIRHDPARAEAAGYRDVPAYPTFGNHDDSVMAPWPPEARDKLLVSDLNHSITNYLPVYAGDTLYTVVNSRDVTDLTPEQGSTRRAVSIVTHASLYNQHGEKVSDEVFRVTEEESVLKDRAKAPRDPDFGQIWEAPDWTKRKAHVYTDADWDFIVGTWKAEVIRGATPRYWEDVRIGDSPAPTLDGPIEESPTPTWGMGMGSGGSRTLEDRILKTGFEGMVRNPVDGIWRLEDPNLQRPAFPPVPSFADAPPPVPRPGAVDTSQIHTSSTKRAALVNFTGRDYAVRHLTNWMGDAGWIRTLNWSIMDPRAHWANGMPVVPDTLNPRYVSRVPGMADRHVTTHGLTEDIALVKSRVTGKRIVNGRHEVELTWWIETIDGDIWEEGSALIDLPSRTAAIDTAVPTVR
ncbi:MaoC family dehydratase N-terminal domain-containing protein [Pseudooceanicola sp. CBS1P-1]|uniref:Uncharacterized protein n=1 Tax=Pseudooceanicola albus TaxID=2692189 RepID=A0A6L7GAA2_9RHOB|nr:MULTISPECIES: MaoC family dehydratase [Pseudooceanicola]MBT9386801.1 MaoC family dehydratase N-terminal domain-containing protein [Pseudooceanicola endophyticus]MXN20941.1 hypothetical protein [Pseudooceanicola albus]